jgi:outer membrane protein TolC
MRLTELRNRRLRAALVVAGMATTGAGCHRSPYIDQTREVPVSAARSEAERTEDQAVQQASWSGQLPTQLPDIPPPRTVSEPETDEIWELTLEDAIRIGLENSEVVRVVVLGAQGIPVGGFEPSPLGLGATAGGVLGAGNLQTVYDPAVQETEIARQLSVFDANFLTSIVWGRNEAPFNNALQAGTFLGSGNRFPVIFDQWQYQYNATLQKRIATGGNLSVAYNVNFLYSNSPANVTPSAYTANTQLRVSQPLLGGSQQTGPSGLEANRAPIVIARLNADISVWRFKSSVMEMVRSIEQQYWALAQDHLQYWSRQTAVQLGEEILRKKEAEFAVGKGSIPDVAEAKEQLERFRLQMLQATANLITTERQLRNLLGLKPNDNRRIIPVTAPIEARLQPDWETCVTQMLSFQPDIVQAQLLVRVSELNLLVARNQLLPSLNLDVLYQFNGLGRDLSSANAVMTGATILAIDPQISLAQRNAGLNTNPARYKTFHTWQVGLTFEMPLGFRQDLANTRAAQYALLRQRAFLQQVVHQQTHALARFFLEVDSNFKLYRTAIELREAAEQRLEAQRNFYEVGQITIDRYLDAVNRWADAVAQEAQFRNSYNTSIAVLEEAKGTLLAYDNIALAEGPHPPKAYIQAIDQRAAHRRLPIPHDGPYQPQVAPGLVVPDPVNPVPAPGFEPLNPRPYMPAPAGTLGPRPNALPPTQPAGGPPILSQSLSPRVDSLIRPTEATENQLPVSIQIPTVESGMELPPLPSPNKPDAPAEPTPELPPLPPE